jgi:hypothetical protein
VEIRFSGTDETRTGVIAAWEGVREMIQHPFATGDTAGIKLHRCTHGNASFPAPAFTRAIGLEA